MHADFDMLGLIKHSNALCDPRIGRMHQIRLTLFDLIWYHSSTLSPLYYICNFQSNYFQNASILHISFQAQLVWNLKLFVQQVWNIKSNFAVLQNIEYELDLFNPYVLWTQAQLVWNLNLFVQHVFMISFQTYF